MERENTMFHLNVAGVVVALTLLYPGLTVSAQDAPKTDPKPSEPAIKVTLKDGIHFKSEDGNLDATLGGYLGLHYRFFPNRPNDNARTSPDGFFVRQLRPELAGTVFKDFDFRVQFDIPTGNGQAAAPSAVTTTVQDAYVGWRHFPELSLRLGQFKEPFGQEQTTPDRRVDFAERSEGDKFTPARDLGAMLYGSLFDNVLGYEAGFFNGGGRGLTDANRGKEGAGRLRIQPFAAGDDGFLFKHLRFGVAGTLARVQNGAIGAFTSNSAYLNVNYLTTAAVATNQLNGERSRWGLESTWNYGPFGLRGEFWRRVDTVSTLALTNQRVGSSAWNASLTWLLTGEQKPVEGRVVPLHAFDPGTGDWGALELAFRADSFQIEPQVFTLGLAPAAGNANRVTAYSAGLNWYVSRGIRISPNFYWENFDDPIAFSGGVNRKHFFGGILRVQLEF